MIVDEVTAPGPWADQVNDDDPIIDENIEVELGRVLREAYADVLEEPIPERFHELIRKLKNETVA